MTVSSMVVIDNDTGEVIEGEWYRYLVEDCKAIWTEAVFNSRWALIEGYHQIGERITNDENFQKFGKGNRSCLQRVANNIGIGERNLYYAVQFYEKYPDINLLPGGKNISWRKVINLLPNHNGSEIDELLEVNQEILDGWNIQYGDVWQVGNHRVMCGDAYGVGNLIILLNNANIDALITDPPYGIDYEPEWKKWDGSPSDFNKIIGDTDPFDPTPFMDYPNIFFFGANYFSDRLPVGGWVCWDKRLNESKDKMYGSPFELGWFISRHTDKKSIMIRVLHGGVVNADSLQGNNEKRLHPTQKPIKVMKRIIEELTIPNESVLDLFMGVGSTLFACENSGRIFYGMEINPNYVAMTLQRWWEATEEMPRLLGG